MADTIPHPSEVATRAELGRALTALRTRASRTVRDLARRLDTPVATLGDYFAGRHLPGPAQEAVFVRLLGECGVTEPSDVEAWMEALWRCRRASDRRSARAAAPYRGLEPFGEEDAAEFFGRERVTGDLVGRLQAAREEGATVALVGASGSGKSSVLRAGVMAAVRSGALGGGGGPSSADGFGGVPVPWSATAITPGEEPLTMLRAAAEALGRPGLLVVDQLEELFAPPVAAADRAAFLAELEAMAGPSLLVLLGLRADFYEAASTEPLLHAVLAHHQVLLGPMSEEELRRAIVEPARRVGAAVDEGLVDLLLADLASRHAEGGAHEPGALPLLSHALLATWERTRANELTLDAYRASGGLVGAVRQSAEDLFGELDPGEQAVARRLFLRLVHVAADAPLTRRRVRREELAALEGAAEGAPVEAVLERFVDARLVTADAGTVAISHEALLGAWPRLASWIEEDRAGLQLRHQLSEVANAWEAATRDEALLLRGSRLQVAEEWLGEAGHREELNRLELDLVEASAASQSAEQQARRRRGRRMQQLLAVTVALMLVAAGLAAYALEARSQANATRDAALSRQLAIEAQQLEPTEPALAMQLALAGYDLSSTVEARSMLLDATAGEMATRLVGPVGPDFVSLGDGGHLLAVARSAADGVQLFRIRGAGTRPRLAASIRLGAPATQVFTVALDRRGRLLAAGGEAKVVDLYDVADPARPRRVGTLRGFSSTVYDVAFNAAGDELAAADNDGSVRVWHLSASAAPQLVAVLRAPKGTVLKAVAFSPDGSLLAAGGSNGTLLVWHNGAKEPQAVSGKSTSTVESLAFSPRGGLLASGSQDGLVRLYTVRAGGRVTPARAPLRGFKSFAYAVAFSPGGATLVAGDADGNLRFWSTATWATEASLHGSNAITSLAYSPTGDALVTADSAGVTRVLPLPLPVTVSAPGNVYFLEFAKAHPSLLAAASGGATGDVGFWNLADPARPRLEAAVGPSAGFGPLDGAAALSPDGRLLALADAKARVELLDVSDLAHPVPVGHPLSGDTPLVEQLSFSPNGKVLAASDDGGAIHRWNLADPAGPVALPTLTGPKSSVLAIAYSPDGRLLAAASADDHVYLYDVAEPARPRRLARLGGFSSYGFSVAFTPDGHTLVAGSGDHTLRLWDVADPGHPRLLSVLRGPTAYVYQVAVSPDGRLLAGATTDGEVWLWDVADPAAPVHLATLRAASGALFSVAFTPDGRTLLASGSDEILHRWTVSPAAAAARVCAVAGTPVSRSEWSEYAPGTPYRPPCR